MLSCPAALIVPSHFPYNQGPWYHRPSNFVFHPFIADSTISGMPSLSVEPAYPLDQSSQSFTSKYPCLICVLVPNHACMTVSWEMNSINSLYKHYEYNKGICHDSRTWSPQPCLATRIYHPYPSGSSNCAWYTSTRISSSINQMRTAPSRRRTMGLWLAKKEA